MRRFYTEKEIKEINKSYTNIDVYRDGKRIIFNGILKLNLKLNDKINSLLKKFVK